MLENLRKGLYQTIDEAYITKLSSDDLVNVYHGKKEVTGNTLSNFSIRFEKVYQIQRLQ